MNTSVPTIEEIQRLKERRSHEVRQMVRRGDLQGAQMALGGELTLEELERNIHWQEQAVERMRQEKQYRAERTEARRQQRFIAKHKKPAARVEIQQSTDEMVSGE